MKFDLTKFPISDDETQLKDEKGKLANYRDVFIKGITSDIDEQGQPVKGEEKYQRYDLYVKIKKAIALVDFTAEDLVLLAKIGLVFPSIVAGQIRDFLARPEAET